MWFKTHLGKAVFSTLLFVCITGTVNLAEAKEKRQPPKEAVEACESANDGDSCSFYGRDDEALNGICGSPPDNDELSCMPEGGPRRD
ncbi:hypothetical protein [Agarivorans sp. Toyoura001]|uniref:hypothetical protein n=1 Tax=unclassified Agarivorans TaxID=2636026 RepID=UPI0010E75455|nr:hypothetical protein [Agarivorans sp. Toyoura001]GDY24283.1 hypothetical protein AHAT_01730 [Agarivorans sp. Toyoura001]